MKLTDPISLTPEEIKEIAAAKAEGAKLGGERWAQNSLLLQELLFNTRKACYTSGLLRGDTDYVVSQTKAVAVAGNMKDVASFSYTLIDAIRNRYEWAHGKVKRYDMDHIVTERADKIVDYFRTELGFDMEEVFAYAFHHWVSVMYRYGIGDWVVSIMAHIANDNYKRGLGDAADKLLMKSINERSHILWTAGMELAKESTRSQIKELEVEDFENTIE